MKITGLIQKIAAHRPQTHFWHPSGNLATLPFRGGAELIAFPGIAVHRPRVG